MSTPSLLRPMSTRISSASMWTICPSTTSPRLMVLNCPSSLVEQPLHLLLLGLVGHLVQIHLVGHIADVLVSVVTVQRLGRGRNLCFVIHPNLLRIDPRHVAWRGYASPFMTVCCGRTEIAPLPALVFVRTTPLASALASARVFSRVAACPLACRAPSHSSWRREAIVQARIRQASCLRREPSACLAVRTPRVFMRSDTSFSAPDVPSVNALQARSVSPSLA